MYDYIDISILLLLLAFTGFLYLIAMSCQLADVCHMVLSYGLKICQQIRLGAKLAGLTKCPSGGVKVQALLNVMVRFDLHVSIKGDNF